MGGKAVQKEHNNGSRNKAGKEHKYFFFAVKGAAINAIERVGNGERVACIEAGGEKVWDAFATSNKKSLVRLAGE